MNFQMFKLVLEKAEEPEIKLPTSTGSLKMQENLENSAVITGQEKVSVHSNPKEDSKNVQTIT